MDFPWYGARAGECEAGARGRVTFCGWDFSLAFARCCFPVLRSIGEGGCIAANLLVFTSPIRILSAAHYTIRNLPPEPLSVFAKCESHENHSLQTMNLVRRGNAIGSTGFAAVAPRLKALLYGVAERVEQKPLLHICHHMNGTALWRFEHMPLVVVSE